MPMSQQGGVLGLSQDEGCSNLFENFHENSLKRDLSNDTTVNPPLFSLVNTFNGVSWCLTLQLGSQSGGWAIKGSRTSFQPADVTSLHEQEIIYRKLNIKLGSRTSFQPADVTSLHEQEIIYRKLNIKWTIQPDDMYCTRLRSSAVHKLIYLLLFYNFSP